MAPWVGKRGRTTQATSASPNPTSQPVSAHSQLLCDSMTCQNTGGTREREWGGRRRTVKRQLLYTHLSSQGCLRHTGLLHDCESQALQGLTTLVGCTSPSCHYGAHFSPVSRCHDTTQAALSFLAGTDSSGLPQHNP